MDDDRFATMRRYIVVGCAGTGKTTFARHLADHIGARHICLDAIWQPAWRGSDHAEFRRRIAQSHAGDAWVSDGNFAKVTFDLRLPRADCIIWLEAPRWLCMWRVFRRVFQHGESHRLKNIQNVMTYIWKFDRINRPIIAAERMLHGAHIPLVHLRSPQEADLWLEEKIPSGGMASRSGR